MSRRPPPVSTHRLQLEPGFTLDDVAAQVDHLAALGVSHLYLSPVLQASEGSAHGYDVVDHTRVASGLGGDAAFDHLAEAARAAGLGLVVDVVPNHMTTPTPLHLNAPLWAVLRDGCESPYAAWFDVDWDAQDGRILLPVLGAPLDEALGAEEITLGREGGEDVVRYYDHVFPIAPGTAGMPLGELLEAQHYRLASWRVGGTELNYRRFFDVTSLIAVRVEVPEVFEATHARLVEMIRSGQVDGLRIDHPDGLADPEGYLSMLAEVTDGAWVVVEKILEGDERLPSGWACAGTTGYDVLVRVGGLFVDPSGATPLGALSDEMLGEHQELEAIIGVAKRHIVDHVLPAEVNRLLRRLAVIVPDVDEDALRRAVTALLVSMDRYRAYVRPGEAMAPDAAESLAEAEARARASVAPGDDDVVSLVADLARGAAATPVPVGAQDALSDFMVRFQQTCGPVMAKAIEDTAYYRFVRLTGLNEVGGNPGSMGTEVDEFHSFAAALAASWPHTMTTLSTHDTKRSEDVRARLAVLSERPGEWARWVRTARDLAGGHRSDRLDALTEYFLWQQLVGAWPISGDRLDAYALKAIREAKLHTSWTEPDGEYERAVQTFARGVAGEPGVVAHVEAWLESTAAETRANVLGQKLVQLTMPGVPDVYQGTDLVDLSLVDPDNRRLVDYGERRRRLARLDQGERPADLSDEKLLVTATALRLRRERPDVFVGEGATYEPLPTDTDHLVAFVRGDASGPAVIVLSTRLAGRLADSGGWGLATVGLPSGAWRDLLSGRELVGAAALADVLGEGMPVALLVRSDDGNEA